ARMPRFVRPALLSKPPSRRSSSHAALLARPSFRLHVGPRGGGAELRIQADQPAAALRCISRSGTNVFDGSTAEANMGLVRLSLTAAALLRTQLLNADKDGRIVVELAGDASRLVRD